LTDERNRGPRSVGRHINKLGLDPKSYGDLKDVREYESLRVLEQDGLDSNSVSGPSSMALASDTASLNCSFHTIKTRLITAFLTGVVMGL
jgi:hypothetical protein